MGTATTTTNNILMKASTSLRASMRLFEISGMVKSYQLILKKLSKIKDKMVIKKMWNLKAPKSFSEFLCHHLVQSDLPKKYCIRDHIMVEGSIPKNKSK